MSTELVINASPMPFNITKFTRPFVTFLSLNIKFTNSSDEGKGKSTSEIHVFNPVLLKCFLIHSKTEALQNFILLLTSAANIIPIDTASPCNNLSL